MSALHGLPRICLVRWVGRAFIEGHDDIGADLPLDIHHGFGREDMTGAVDVGLEFDSIGSYAAQARQAENLESAAVGEQRAVPALEAVEPARCRDSIFPRPQM